MEEERRIPIDFKCGEYLERTEYQIVDPDGEIRLGHDACDIGGGGAALVIDRAIKILNPRANINASLDLFIRSLRRGSRYSPGSRIPT